MFVPGDDGWDVFVVRCKFLQTDFISRLDIVPAPYKLVECLFLGFFVCYHFWVTGCVIYLTQFLYGYFRPHNFSHSVICILNCLGSVLVKFPSYVFHEIRVRYVITIGSEIVTNVSDFFFSQVQFTALKTPSEIVFIKGAWVLLIEAFEDFVQKPDTVNSSFS